MKILLTGGGTGGHIIPILAVVSEIKKRVEGKGMEKAEFLMISSNRESIKNISSGGIPVKIIKTGKLRRYFSLKNLTDIFKIPAGIIQSLRYIYEFKPNIVFSKGGFASIPPVIAARILKVPILTHESDIVPGLANKIISFFATEVFVSHPETGRYFKNKNIITTGNPIRDDISKGSKEKARKFFGLKEGLPAVLVFGGSQGAKKLNDAVLKSLVGILEKCQVIHICGAKNYDEVKKTFKRMNLKPIERYRACPYLAEEMKDAFALADIVVSRAGANSLAEIMALEKPSIVIPLPSSANNHQLKNARYFAKKGAIILLEEKDLTAENLKKSLFELLSDKNKIQLIRQNIVLCNKSTNQNAAKLIAEKILDFCENEK